MTLRDQVIALDGPSGSGKSTVAKKVAEELQLIYIDTGAMFRAVSYALQTLHIDFSKDQLTAEEDQKVSQFLHDHKFSYAPAPGILVQLDHLNLTDHLRDHHVSKLASQVSKFKVIRDYLAHWQREIVKGRGAILDGRDIGTVIFPHARLKIYMTASAEERADRRLGELQGRGETSLDKATILKDIIERDHQDMNRAIAPLKKASDAVELDTTSMTIDQIVKDIVDRWTKLKG